MVLSCLEWFYSFWSGWAKRLQNKYWKQYIFGEWYSFFGVVRQNHSKTNSENIICFGVVLFVLKWLGKTTPNKIMEFGILSNRYNELHGYPMIFKESTKHILFSWITDTFQRLSLIFKVFQRLTMISNDFQTFSMNSMDLQRCSKNLERFTLFPTNLLYVIIMNFNEFQ